MARALRSQRRGREFDSHHLHRSTGPGGSYGPNHLLPTAGAWGASLLGGRVGLHGGHQALRQVGELGPDP